jgi:hypothetical protein
MKRVAIGAAALWVAGVAGGWGAESALKNIRISRDGAGPSHLFWLAGPSQIFPDRDVVGIVDPLLAAIRLYTVRRLTPAGEKFNDRLERIGACALPIPFRPWRILHLKDQVQIEGMPQPGSNGHNANEPDFRSPLYSVKRDLVAAGTRQALEDAGKIIDDESWNPTAATPCGVPADAAAPVGRTAPFRAMRGANRPKRTIILRNSAAALTDARPLTVRARTGGKFYLFSIKELEPAPSTRVVQITEGVPTTDGMIRLNQRLLLFGKDGSKPFGEISFDDTHFRSKIGQKPLAVLPTGEVLAMGKQNAGGKSESEFRIQSCGFVGAVQSNAKEPLCSDETQIAVSERQDSDPKPGKDDAAPGKDGKDEPASTTGENANSIFERVSDLAVFPWEVDTDHLPKDCRTTSGCEVKGQNISFVPLKGIRLTRGKHSQNGLPYAQTETFLDFDRFFDAFGRQRFDKAPSGQNRFAAALKNVKTTQESLPGNLADDFTGDLGIDCSALVQLAWNGRSGNEKHRTSTEAIQNGAVSSVPYRCPNRLPDPSYLRSGDAIGISVKGAGEHVLLYAANIPFDGASESWLVLESSSSCDGVCWSVYDPSYFNGWALYRASNRDDKKCLASASETSIVANPFPADLAGWRKKVVEGLPGRR